MDPLKIIIFVGAFLLLLLLGRKLSAAGEVHASQLPQPTPIQPGGINRPIDDTLNDPTPGALVGSDLTFPVQLPELEIDRDGKYNRPEFINYYFGSIDLVQGPPDPTCFCDEFFVETRDPANEHIGTWKYIVATPDGLRREMARERLQVLNLGDQALIVAQWNLTLILDAAVKEIIRAYRGWQTADEHALPGDEPSA